MRGRVHPKVAAPTLLGVVVGFGLLAFGEREVGVTVIVSALGHGAVGFAKGGGA